MGSLISSMKYIVSNMEDWKSVASAVLSALEPGTIILLRGPLGAGKTTFVQTLAATLGIKKIPKSPTFSLLRTYIISNNRSLKQLVHIDAYRLEAEKDVLALGLDEIVAETGNVIAIEWPERLGSYLHKLPGKHIVITIEPEAREGIRRVRIQF